MHVQAQVSFSEKTLDLYMYNKKTTIFYIDCTDLLLQKLFKDISSVLYNMSPMCRL